MPDLLWPGLAGASFAMSGQSAIPSRSSDWTSGNSRPRHAADLVTPDYKAVRFYLTFGKFEVPGTPATKDDYVTYREATLEFIAGRGRRMAEWVTEHHPEIEVRNPWWRPR